VSTRGRVTSGLTLVAVVSLAAGVVIGMSLPLPGGSVEARSLETQAPVAALTASPPDPGGGSSSPAAAPSSPPPAEASARPVPSDAPATAAPPTTEPTPVRVPILYYHRVQPLPAGFASWALARQRDFLQNNVLPRAFAAQLDWLRAHGYTTILPRDLAAYWDRGSPLPPKPVILTFDDGTTDWVSTVGPLLRERGMVAEFYVVVQNVARALTWDELRTLADAGNGIGAHGVHHVQLTALGTGQPPASPEVMRSEVQGARQKISIEIGRPPDSFAYVGGGYDATLTGIVQAAGYTTARGIERGLVQDPDHRFTLRVVRIGGHDDVSNLRTGKLVRGLPTFERRVTGRDPG
jgi:peptidoglycan/xylan/chitin deacetylase (PgdA/CDA1 family)